MIVIAVVAMTSAASAERRSRARHERLTTSHGPVHVWTPAGYDPATAGIVLYVHGYFTDVDHAWTEHHLARQFAESGLNAVFIACEAPDGPRDPVSWASAHDLLEAVASALDEPLPDGVVYAVGHSGAHRTLSAWAEAGDDLDAIALLDALYGDQPEIRNWIEGSDDRRLIDVSNLTRPWADRLHEELPETMIFERFPPRDHGHLRGARTARVVHVHSQIGHMPLVTGGVALPMVLRASRIASLHRGDRRAPIRGL